MLKQRGGFYRFLISLSILVALAFSVFSQNLIAGIFAGIATFVIGQRVQGKLKGKHTIDMKTGISLKRFSWIGFVLIGLLIIFIYFFRPWFHEMGMAFYRLPALWVFLILSFSAALLASIKWNKLAITTGLLAALSLVVIVLNMIIVQNYIVDSTDYNKISALPDSDGVRILPKAVARRYLEDSLQKSREKVGDLNIVTIDEKLFWIAPRIPDGTILYFTQKVNGLMLADAGKSDRSTELVTRTLPVGEGIGITDNIYWKIYKERYWLDLGDIYYIYKDDKIYTIAPIIRYSFRFPVMVPYYGGVFVIDEQGAIAMYGPTEAVSNPLFQDNRAFPEELARLYVDSYKYHLGVWNTWFLHKDQIEIADVYGQQNRQPFLMPTSDGLKWVVATEPYGESYGVFKIFLVDALTGRIDLLEMDEDRTLTGPVRVVSYVKKKFPRIDWGTAAIAEPRPYVVDSDLYWMLSITPRDAAGISYSVFVNSANNDVISAESDAEVNQFLEGAPIPEPVEEDRPDIRQLIEEIEQKLARLKDLVESEQTK
jgi:hypothetical protein